MNREDIIRMALEANFYESEIGGNEDGFVHFAALVAEVEREACAKVCDPEPSQPNEAYTVLNNKATMRRCAAAIRARSNT